MPDSKQSLFGQTLAPRNWMPLEFVGAVAQQSLEDFQSEFCKCSFLLVQLAETSGQLAIALQRASTLTNPQTASSDDITYTTLYCREVTDVPLSPTRGFELDDHITPAMVSEPHFIVPIRLRNREEADLTDRIWVGRAHNNDIVLRHNTVSKCHAWFRYDEEGQISVRDAKSRNGTRVNGQSIEQERVEVRPGDRINFGSVETQLCSALALWRVLSY